MYLVICIRDILGGSLPCALGDIMHHTSLHPFVFLVQDFTTKRSENAQLTAKQCTDKHNITQENQSFMAEQKLTNMYIQINCVWCTQIHSDADVLEH